MGTSTVIILDDGSRILDIKCHCGTHSQVISEDIYEHTCRCGTAYFNLAYYYFDKDSMICFNEHYYKLKANKEKEQ